MGIPVKLQVFEGPLDLLLHLIDKNKIDIYDIPIVEITNQYMEYIRLMEQEDLNTMSEFLVMAATLLDIKCRMEGEKILYREPAVPEEVLDYVEPVDLDELLSDLTLSKLNHVFRDVMRRKEEKLDPVRSRFGRIEKEEVTVAEKLAVCFLTRAVFIPSAFGGTGIQNADSRNFSGRLGTDEERKDQSRPGKAV